MNYLVDLKGRFFNDAYAIAKSLVLPNDYATQKKFTELLKLKKLAESKVYETKGINISSIITEKEKIQLDLENALCEIDKLKTLVAESTLNSLFTAPAMDDGDEKFEM